LFPLFVKFTTGVVDTSNLPTMSNLPLANISLNFRKKFEMTQMLFSWAWGKMIHEKKPEAKNLVTLFL
jgi:hypothetical protein